MKLFDATLDLASFAKGTEDYTVSSVSGAKLYCDELAGRVAEFGGGTIWVMSGDAAGYFGRIRSASAQNLELESAVTGLAAGDQITIGSWLEFDTQKLINAVNSVLRTYKVLDTNFDLEYDPSVELYELPDGVTEDVRSVQLRSIRDIGDQPQWKTCHYWRIMPSRTLYIYERRKLIYKPESPIALSFVRMHGAVGKTDEIMDQVDPLYLRYMSWLYLCRNLIQNTHKDNLMASDMYNEAKVYERDYSKLPNKALGIRQFTFPQW